MGPLSDSEQAQLKERDIYLPVLQDGRCRHHELEPLGCGLHRRHGEQAKPSTCQRFPFGVIKTPHGFRITTRHRCPCRSLGPRAPIDAAEVEALVRLDPEHVEVSAIIPDALPVEDDAIVSFDAYVRSEENVIGRLLKGDSLFDVFGVEPSLPALAHFEWADAAMAWRSGEAGRETAYDRARMWLGWGICELLDLSDDKLPPPIINPQLVQMWELMPELMDEESPRRMMGDWLADAIWEMPWMAGADQLADGGRGRQALRRYLTDLQLRYLVAEAIIERLVGAGQRPDFATANALTVIDTAALGPAYQMLIDDVAPLPSGWVDELARAPL